MEWMAKYYDNVYLLTDDDFNMREDKVVYLSPEDNTIVVDHRSLNNPEVIKPYKIVWCYEPGDKLAGPVTHVWLPFTTRLAAATMISADLIPVQTMEQPELGNWFYETTGYQ